MAEIDDKSLHATDEEPGSRAISEMNSGIEAPKFNNSNESADEIRTRVQRRTLRVLAAAQIFGSLGLGVGSSIGVLLAEEVTNSEAWASLARTSTTIGASIAAIPLAALASRLGRRRALGTAWMMAFVGAILLVTAANTKAIPLLVVGMLLSGVGAAGTLQARFSAADCALPTHRGRALSIVVWVGTVGSVIGPNMGKPGALLADRVGMDHFAGPYIIGAVCLCVAAIMIWVGLRPDPLFTMRQLSQVSSAAPQTTAAPAPKSGSKRSTKGAFAVIRSSQQASFALLAAVLAQGSMVAVMTMTPVHMTRQGDSLEVVGFTISLHIVGMYAFSPLVGMASDRFGTVKVIVAGQVLFAVTAAVTSLATSSVGVVAGLFLLGLAWSLVTVPAATLLTSSVPEHSRPAAQGFTDMAIGASGAVCSAGAGALMMVIGFSGLSLAAGMGVIPVLLTVVFMRRGKRTP